MHGIVLASTPGIGLDIKRSDAPVPLRILLWVARETVWGVRILVAFEEDWGSVPSTSALVHTIVNWSYKGPDRHKL